jgi:hypothetical protein
LLPDPWNKLTRCGLRRLFKADVPSIPVSVNRDLALGRCWFQVLSSKASRVLGLGSAHDSKINYFQQGVLILLTMVEHAPNVITDLGFFSSPEHNGS